MRGGSGSTGVQAPANPELIDQIQMNSNNIKAGMPLLECILLNTPSIGRFELDNALGTNNSPAYVERYRTRLVQLMQRAGIELGRLEVITTDRVTYIKSNGRPTKIGFYRLHPLVKQYLIQQGRNSLCS